MSFAHQNVVHEVPEKIKKWREDQAKMLEEKDENEKKTIEKLRKEAEKELADWYDTYRSSKEKTKTINRNAEKDMTTADTNGNSDDSIWEKISSLCDFGGQAKAPKNGRDTTRMRSIFLQLKSSPLPAKTN
jgi:vacuolar-type H+-ATPase subunit H